MTDPAAPAYGRYRPAHGCVHRHAALFPLPNGETGCLDCLHVAVRRDGNAVLYEKPFEYAKRGVVSAEPKPHPDVRT